MGAAEDLAVAVLRSPADVAHRWPRSDRWVAMAAWRQQPVGAVLVVRQRVGGELFFDVVAGKLDGDDWYVLGSGGSSVRVADAPDVAQGKVDWICYQDFVFEQENGEEAYVATFVGVAASGVDWLRLRFSNGSQVETTVTSDDRLVFAATVRSVGEDLTVHAE